ncbi:MAG: hypothetical protein DSM106950_44455 [Stigonema ocellatum SAG 48.90 = DSM 106950]|nr:hypothetical protein [Stigonema ocellatum SAG 48.90 = DSM 106950]
MTDIEPLDSVDINIKLFFNRFVKAAESKNEQELNELISDHYSSTTLMNRNKKDLVSFIIRGVPNIPLLKLKLDAEFYEFNFFKEKQECTLIIKPKYALKFLGIINLAEGIFGRSEKVYVSLRRHPETGLYCVDRMDDVTQVDR